MREEQGRMKKRRITTILMVGVLVGSFGTDYVYAKKEMAPKTKTLETIGFAGREWLVIGKDGSGVYSKKDSVTLLAKSMLEDYKNIPFRENGDFAQEEQIPNEYFGSTVQLKMEEIASGFPLKEQEMIRPRTLEGEKDGIVGQKAENQKMWALSESEWKQISEDENVVRYDDWWWMRSAGSLDTHAGECSGTDGRVNYDYVDFSEDAIRPALVLDTSDVFLGFCDEKSTEVGVLDAIVEEDTAKKLTVKDEEQHLVVSATEEQSSQRGEVLEFTYSDATKGKDQYISCVFWDEEDNVKYYGKLRKNIETSSGELNIPLKCVKDGMYEVAVFSEKVNDNLHVDFSSMPVTMSLSVEAGKGSVSDFSGEIEEHKHSYNVEKAEDEYKATSATCVKKATYYKSCECGAKGPETFEFGMPLGHEMGEWKIIESPQCEEDGSKQRYCLRCDYAEAEELEAEGHDWQEQYTIDKATECEEDGSQSIHCSKCDARMNSEVIPATGHRYEDGKCVVCGKTETPADESSKDETVNQEIEENEVNTGDKTLIMAWIFALISGIAGIISYRKKSKV